MTLQRRGMPPARTQAASNWMQLCERRLGGMPSAEWIAGRVTTLLSHFYRPDIPEEVAEAVMMDWISALRNTPKDAIQAGCASYLSSATTTRPTPGVILDLAHKWIAEQGLAPKSQPEPERQRVSAESAKAILDAAGFRPKRVQEQRGAKQ